MVLTTGSTQSPRSLSLTRPSSPAAVPPQPTPPPPPSSSPRHHHPHHTIIVTTPSPLSPPQPPQRVFRKSAFGFGIIAPRGVVSVDYRHHGGVGLAVNSQGQPRGFVSMG
ncbi:hypothetical protein Tco_1273702 [Tanacetum coccineum]